MPTRNQSGKPSRVFQNKNRKRKKSGKKLKKVIKHFLMLAKKEKKEGLTKRIQQARKMVHAKMKKYGITTDMIEEIGKGS